MALNFALQASILKVMLRKLAKKILPTPKVVAQLKAIRKAPLSAEAHLALAQKYASAGLHTHAVACFRTAQALGDNGTATAVALAASYMAEGRRTLALDVAESLRQQAPSEAARIIAGADGSREIPLEEMDHNTYYRYRSLSDHIHELYRSEPYSVLDVGGGSGGLCQFIPEASYVLAEPGVNGLSGEDLPFKDKSFDAVVSCHVLEHIPTTWRTEFLDSLCSKARGHVLLLNPFHQAEGHFHERVELIIEITGAQWAKEHRECGLPEVKEVRDYAEARGYGCRITPNGSLTLSMAYVMLEHYASLAGRKNELRKINAFFNTRFHELMTNPTAPVGHMVELSLKG